MVIRKNLLPTALGLQCQPWTMNMVKSRWWPYGRRCAWTSHTLALPIFPNAIRPSYGGKQLNTSYWSLFLSISNCCCCSGGSPGLTRIPRSIVELNVEFRMDCRQDTRRYITYQQCRMCAYHCDMKVVRGGLGDEGHFAFAGCTQMRQQLFGCRDNYDVTTDGHRARSSGMTRVS